MANPEDIRAGLAGALRAAFRDVQVSEYVLANPTAPGLEIDMDPEGVSYDEAMARGHDEWWWIVRGFVSGATDKGAQIRRDEWLASSGSSSVKAAVETDETLGGACFDLRVVSAQPRVYTVDNSQYVGAEWRVQVWATGI
jgi:hypothetical protein